MLDVHGREYVDPGVEKLQHILVALGMLAAFHVGVGQFVHQDHPWFAGKDGIHVHLIEDRAFVFNFLAWDALQLRSQIGRRLAPMGLDDSNHDVLAPVVAADGFTQHAVSLPYPRRVTQEQFEHSTLLRRRSLFQPLLRSFSHRGYCR